MPHHEEVTCPRCKDVFECKMGSITLCHCSNVTLNEAQREYIAFHWNECLCNHCLRDISRMMLPAMPKALSAC